MIDLSHSPSFSQVTHSSKREMQSTQPLSGILTTPARIIMPLGIPEAMQIEHEELHEELRKATKMPGEVGKAAKKVAEVLHPHFERENELALPVIGVARELAEGKTSTDFGKALKLHNQFKKEYRNMLREHKEVVKALNQLAKAAKTAKKPEVLEFTRKLKLHAQIEEDLTYPAVLLIGKLLAQK